MTFFWKRDTRSLLFLSILTTLLACTPDRTQEQSEQTCRAESGHQGR